MSSRPIFEQPCVGPRSSLFGRRFADHLLINGSLRYHFNSAGVSERCLVEVDERKVGFTLVVVSYALSLLTRYADCWVGFGTGRSQGDQVRYQQLYQQILWKDAFSYPLRLPFDPASSRQRTSPTDAGSCDNTKASASSQSSKSCPRRFPLRK